MQIRMEHVRAAMMCSRGARAWARRYGLNYRRFLAEGCPEEVILETGDALGRLVVEAARKLEAGGRNGREG